MFNKYESKRENLESKTQICKKMAATNKTLVFSAAVHGFHVYGAVWNPHENEELVGLFEKKQFV